MSEGSRVVPKPGCGVIHFPTACVFLIRGDCLGVEGGALEKGIRWRPISTLRPGEQRGGIPGGELGEWSVSVFRAFSTLGLDYARVCFPVTCRGGGQLGCHRIFSPTAWWT